MLPWTDRTGRFAPGRAVVFAALLVPGLWTAIAFATEALGARPLNAVIDTTGLWAIRLLFISLAITPARRMLHWPKLIGVRRMVGVASFAYAGAHLLCYAADQSFGLGKIVSEIALRFYLTLGFVALAGLAALALTSTDGMMRRLGGKRWRRLHRLVYAIAILGTVHYFLQTKLALGEPMFMAGVLFWLFGCRLLDAGFAAGAAPLWATTLLAFGAGALTLLGEAGYFWLKFGADPLRVLAADLAFSTGLRPGWAVLAVALGVSALGALRERAARPSRVRLRPA